MNNQGNNTQPATVLDETAQTVLEYFDLLQQVNELLEEWLQLE